MDSLSRRAKRRRKKKKGKKDRTLLLQKCLRAGYNRMEGRHCAKECETSHKNKLLQTPRSLTHKLARDTTQYIQHQHQHNINTTLTQHNTHQKSKCKSVDTRTTGWDGVGSRHENPMK